MKQRHFEVSCVGHPTIIAVVSAIPYTRSVGRKMGRANATW